MHSMVRVTNCSTAMSQTFSLGAKRDLASLKAEGWPWDSIYWGLAMGDYTLTYVWTFSPSLSNPHGSCTPSLSSRSACMWYDVWRSTHTNYWPEIATTRHSYVSATSTSFLSRRYKTRLECMHKWVTSKFIVDIHSYLYYRVVRGARHCAHSDRVRVSYFIHTPHLYSRTMA